VKFLALLQKKIAGLRERINIPFFHKCPAPPSELMAVLARIGERNIWEQRRCSACKRITHWRRDHPSEPFKPWSTLAENIVPFLGHPGGMPISADLSKDDLRASR